VTWFPYDEQICDLSFISWDNEDEVRITDFDRWFTHQRTLARDLHRRRADHDSDDSSDDDSDDKPSGDEDDDDKSSDDESDDDDNGWRYFDKNKDDSDDDRKLQVKEMKNSSGLQAPIYDGEWKIIGKYLQTFTVD
jgi:hypothetical protein